MKVSELFGMIGDRDLVRQILSYVCDMPMSQVFLLEKVELRVAKKALCIAEDVKKGIPLAYAVGKTWFYGLPFVVNYNVLVPRNDTEVLVEVVLDCLRTKRSNPDEFQINKNSRVNPSCKLNEYVLDLCTGSGCVAVAVAKNFGAKVFASDISSKALEVARENAKINNVDIKFMQGDLFEGTNEKFDVIVSNPPYVRTEDIGIADRTVLHEPRLALDGGEDGLEFYRRIISNAGKYLVELGMLVVEIGFDQGMDIVKLFEKNGFVQVEIKKDLAGNDRVVMGFRDNAIPPSFKKQS